MLARLVPQGAKRPKDVGNVLWLALVSLSGRAEVFNSSTSGQRHQACACTNNQHLHSELVAQATSRRMPEN